MREMGECLGAERVTCPLFVITVKPGLEAQGTVEAGPGRECRKLWGPALRRKLSSRRQVSGQSDRGPRRGGHRPADQPPRHQHPAGSVRGPCVERLPAACASEPWATAGSQGSAFKARVDSREQAGTRLSKCMLGNVTRERQLVSLLPEMRQESG